MAENKIKYGISKCAYAVATIAANGSATYGDVVDLPGAVSIALTQQGERSVFYADNIEYYVMNINSGYEGDLTLARIPDDFCMDVLGEVEDSKKVLIEVKDKEPIHFALLFQFEGDQNATRHVLYNCTAARPDINGNTKEENIAPETEAITITAKSIYNSVIDDHIVKGKSKEDTDSTTYNAWFTSVHQPVSSTP